MQIGCSAPTSGPLIDPDSLLRIATEAEALGFDYVTVSDHMMIPTTSHRAIPIPTAANSLPAPRRPAASS